MLVKQQIIIITINLLKKVFQLNLQCQISKTKFSKNTLKECCFIFTLNTSKLVTD